LRRITEILSKSNLRYKALHRLVQSSQERRRTGLSVLDGAHLVAAYCEHVGRPEDIVVNRAGLADPEVQAILEAPGLAAPTVLGDALFREVSSVATPTGIMAVVRTPLPRPMPVGIDACVMLEELQDPGNLGSILRSCAAAGVEHVLLSPGCVHAWSPRVLRAGMGAHFKLCVHERVDLLAAVRSFEGRVLATRGGARRSLYDADLAGNVAFVFGNEGSGLSPALRSAAHLEVAIPMPGMAESLNVAAAVAVCLFERIRQLTAVPHAG
jgi:TrmH family RNA methyltransferase